MFGSIWAMWSRNYFRSRPIATWLETYLNATGGLDGRTDRIMTYCGITALCAASCGKKQWRRQESEVGGSCPLCPFPLVASGDANGKNTLQVQPMSSQRYVTMTYTSGTDDRTQSQSTQYSLRSQANSAWQCATEALTGGRFSVIG